jgi:hypothetical protein
VPIPSRKPIGAVTIPPMRTMYSQSYTGSQPAIQRSVTTMYIPIRKNAAAHQNARM